jgi:succinyl-CoA synthetase alpha subunit
MIFSDNVTIEDEKRLKAMGEAEGLLVMGPDCGTAMINGAGLGFANAVPRGPVGIVSASGTGAQEVSSILARIGTGVSHIIGTGGRDVSDHIGGAMTKAGLQTLIAHDNTRVIVVISKAPSAAVAKEILATAEAGGKPCVVYFAGSADRASRGCVSFARTLTDAALEAAKAAGVARPSVMSASDGGAERLARCASRIPSGRKYVRGLYSGGTLAQEAVFVFGGRLSPIATNMKLPGTVLLGDPSTTKGHTIVDLGDDAFTRGRPHPMIDQAYRLVRLERELSDPETAVILLDVVLGYGCNPDPAREIAGALTRFRQAAGRGEEAALPVVIASVCGTAADPQNYDGQKLQLQSAGVEVAPTNALAAAWALDLLERR